MDTHNGHGLGGHLHVRVDVDYQPPVRPGQLSRQVFRDIVESAEVRPLSLHLYMDGLSSFGRPHRRSLRHIDHVPLALLPHGVHLWRGLAGGQQQQQRNDDYQRSLHTSIPLVLVDDGAVQGVYRNAAPVVAAEGAAITQKQPTVFLLFHAV